MIVSMVICISFFHKNAPLNQQLIITFEKQASILVFCGDYSLTHARELGNEWFYPEQKLKLLSMMLINSSYFDTADKTSFCREYVNLTCGSHKYYDRSFVSLFTQCHRINCHYVAVKLLLWNSKPHETRHWFHM